jgi:hypothetical protein
MSRAVDIDDLTDEEQQLFYEAVQCFRGRSAQQSFHSVPIRDDAGTLEAVKIYWHSDDLRAAATVNIVCAADGQIGFEVK